MFSTSRWPTGIFVGALLLLLLGVDQSCLKNMSGFSFFLRILNALEPSSQPLHAFKNSGDHCKKRNTLRSEKPQFCSWPFIGKKGMLLHENAKNLLKPRKITSWIQWSRSVNVLVGKVVSQGLCFLVFFFQWKKVNLPAEKYTCWEIQKRLVQFHWNTGWLMISLVFHSYLLRFAPLFLW